MLNWSLLQSILIIAMACSSVSVLFVQKTKVFCSNSKQVPVYSFVVNVILGFIFSQTFSDISYINSLWAGLFSFLGADTLYKSLEGNIASYSELSNGSSSTDEVKNDDIDKQTDNTSEILIDNGKEVDDSEIVGEITYE